jgi:transcriptional regulator with XRE-family HTH domain
MSQITGGQVRAARGFLDWTQGELAARSKVGTSSIKRIEHVDGPARASALVVDALVRALEGGGIEFLDDAGVPGVRLRKKRRARARASSS